jgi:hypothetical protein
VIALFLIVPDYLEDGLAADVDYCNANLAGGLRKTVAYLYLRIEGIGPGRPAA